MSAKNELRAGLVELGEKIGLVILGFILFCFVSGGFLWFIRLVLDSATKGHWVLGILVAVFLLVLLVAFQVLLGIAISPNSPNLRRSIFGNPGAGATGFLEQYPGVALSILLGIIVCAAVLSMATISNVLHGETELVEYQFRSTGSLYSRVIPSEKLASELLDYYGWHLIDSIPVLGIWKIFGVDPPLAGKGFLSGVLVLLFRVVIVAQCIGLIRSWAALQKHVSAREQAPLGNNSSIP